MKKVRWGVLGCGGIAARRTIPEFKKMVSNAEIVSVMDIDRKRADAVAKQFGVPHACAREAELLARKDVDAVYVATPQNMHCRQVVQSFEAGKHVLCEKPIAITIAEVDQMEAACRRAGKRFMLAWCMRQNVYNSKMRELVLAGKLGKMVMARAELTCWFPPIADAWRQDVAISHGGALLDMGTHCLDLLEWIMDTEITEVTGFQDLLVHNYRTRIEDSSTIVARFRNGAHGIIDNYFNVPDAAAQNRLELYGTRGAILADGTVGQDPTGKMFSVLQEVETGYNANQVRNVEPSRQEYHFDGIGLYGQMITLFSDCVLQDAEPPSGFKTGRHSVRVVDAIYRAVREKRVVQVAD